ncbi:unnamed protein product [Linum tenue]|uniref:RING-type domain-containing protein n=1 Tax=Linum tenue TaxID=586396 RepID=A0AAV0KVJ3_9ROSI|nr:unnamed protein product [Linum tenue]
MSNAFAKTICSICYEDLKPIVEDLQVISICGHVFHELCLQQWFEYCWSKKKCSCPVCKQRCKGSDVARLYFQSLGGSADYCVSQCEETQADAKLLGGEIVRLEGKVRGLNSTVDCQGKEIERLNGEVRVSGLLSQLYDCKKQLKAELALKEDVVQEKASVEEMLRFKSQELDALKADHLKLQDKSMAVAKELAALKLASDLNLEEEEILKLASFGNEANAKDTIDILRKSLVTRNKTYQELMAKCNQLGRGEARSSKKLGKAKEKIIRLKTKIQELEMAVELKENQALRLLKTSKDTSSTKKIPGGLGDKLDTPTSEIFRPGSENEQVSSISLDCLVRTGSPIGDAKGPFSINDYAANFTDEPSGNQACDKKRNNYSIIDEGDQDLDLEHPTRKQQNKEHPMDNAGRTNRNKDTTSSAAAKETSFSIGGNIDVCPAMNIKKELPSSACFSKPDICFSSGLLGPDGTTRYLGKWCKRDQSKQSVAVQKTSTNSGDLIAVGADGRGGRVKVARPLNQALMFCLIL